MSPSDDAPSHISVRDDAEQHRYVIEVDHHVAGFAVYHVRAGRHLFVHTEIDAAYEGQGVGSTLIRAALDDVRSEHGIIVPICPFVAGWVDRHPDYQNLVDRDLLRQIAPSGEERLS